MANNIFKKITLWTLAFTMVISQVIDKNSVSAANNTNAFVQSNIIEGENKQSLPVYQASSDTTGSNLSEGSTEGGVFFDKTIEKIGNDGHYKINLYARGFGYREVDNDNKKTTKYKNPLKEGSVLKVTEEIDSHFELVPSTLTTVNHEGLNTNSIHRNDGNSVSLTFNANEVKDLTSHYTSKTAFDAQISFEVQLKQENRNTQGTYETKKANASFEPSLDNFYYYEWGMKKSEAYFNGVKWNARGTGLNAINELPLTLPNMKGIESGDYESYNFSIEVDGKKVNRQSGEYPNNLEKRSDYEWGYLIKNGDVQPGASVDGDLTGIKDVIFYAKVVGSSFRKVLYFRVEILDENNHWTCFEPVEKLQNNGGNSIGDKYTLGEVISKTQAQLRPDYTLNQGLIKEELPEYAKIVITVVTKDNIKQRKTAKVMSWDDRTYQIDLYAGHNIKPTDSAINLVIMLDFSGSMPWFVQKPTGGTIKLRDLKYNPKYKNEKYNETLEKGGDFGLGAYDYKYYVLRESEGGAKEYKPICFHDGEWRFLKSHSDGHKVVESKDIGKVTSTEDIYIRREGDQTKYEALFTSISYFLQNMKIVSPSSKVAIIPFAGKILPGGDSEFRPVTYYDQNAVNKLFQDIALAGGTRHDIAMNKAIDLIENSGVDQDNTYGLLFSDGDITKANKVETTDPETAADKAAASLKNKYVNLLFTAGIFAKENTSGAEKMKKWASEKDGKQFVYIKDTAQDLINAFSDIFGQITTQIKNVTVKDYIDPRFDLIDRDGKKLEVGETINGGTIREDSNGIYVEWDNVNLSYCDDIKTGWHKTIYVKAKENYIGGNNIPTNIGGISAIYMPDEGSQPFDRPEVNVKVDFNVGNASETLFYDEKELFNWKKMLDPVLEKYTINPDGKKLTLDDFTLTWSKEQSNGMIDKNLTIDDISNLEVKDGDKYYLEVTLNGVGESKGDALSNTGGQSNDMNVDKELIAKNIDDTKPKYCGVYEVKVVDGEIQIVKNIDKSTKGYQGDPIFTFKLTGTAVDGTQVEMHRTVRYTNQSTGNLTVNFEHLKRGTYEVVELKPIRYTLTNIDPVKGIEGKEDYAAKDWEVVGNTLQGSLGENKGSRNINCRNISAQFNNTLNNEENVSDTDLLKNSFSIDENGVVTITPSHENGR